MKALAANIRYLSSIVVEPGEMVGILNLFGPRIHRLLNECKIIGNSEAFEAVKAYFEILNIDVSALQPPIGAIGILLKRCQGILYK